eukprot:gene13261-biopygen2268
MNRNNPLIIGIWGNRRSGNRESSESGKEKLPFPSNNSAAQLAATAPLAAQPGQSGGTAARRHSLARFALTTAQFIDARKHRVRFSLAARWHSGGTVPAQSGSMAAQWRHRMAARRHSGSKVEAQTVPLAALTGGTAARRQSGGNGNLGYSEEIRTVGLGGLVGLVRSVGSVGLIGLSDWSEQSLILLGT